MLSIQTLRLGVLAALTTVVVSSSIKKIDSKCLSEECQLAADAVIDSLDNTTDPCDDFYAFACGHFEDSHNIPQGKILWDNFQILQEIMDNRSKDILKSSILSGEPEAVTKAKNMYASCMDTELLDSLDLSPVVTLIHNWGNWPVLNVGWTPMNWSKMADIVSEFAVPFVFSVSTLASLDNANTTAIYLDAPSLVLPTPLLSDMEKPDILEALSRAEGDVGEYPFTRYLRNVATLLRNKLGSNVSDEDILKDMSDVVVFMQRLQQATRALSNYDVTKSMAWTIEQLDQWTKENLGNRTSMVWLDFLQRSFTKSGVTVEMDHPVILPSGGDGLINIIQLVENTDPRVLANYVMSRLLVFLSPESSKEMREAAFNFYVEMGYITEDYPRWLYCVHKVQDYPNVGFSHAVAYRYKSMISAGETLSKAQDMVVDLLAAFQELLSENEWMDENTRQIAAMKAENMLVLLGFPSWCDTGDELDAFYSKINVSRGDHFGNVARLRAFVQASTFATLGKERNRNEWTQSPLVVNAFYNSLNNRITFPVGMMDVPFFSGIDYEKSLDYGRIGAIVGHEITHGFDSAGRQYDQFGSAFDWWSNDTDTRFEKKAQCFVEQYNSYKVQELNQTVDGTKTLRENIADNGGVREAYRAFKRLQTRRGAVVTTPRLPGLEQYSAEQLFFIGYASMWCRAETVDGMATMLQKDSHSPNRFRVIGSLSNMAEFSEVFQCPLNSKMNPEHKCVLW